MIDGLEAQHEGRIVSSGVVEHVKGFINHLVRDLDNIATAETTDSFVADKSDKNQRNQPSSDATVL